MPLDLLHRLRALLQRNTVEQELDEELRFHLEREAGKLMQRGVGREEATRRARLAFGGVEEVKERCREARGTLWLEELEQDLHYGSRILRKAPGFTLAVAGILALGIGATTALFSVAHAVLLRWLPVPNPQELVVLARDPRRPYVPHSRPEYLRLRDYGGRVFRGVAASNESLAVGFSVVTPDRAEAPIVAHAAFVSGTYFGVLGVEPFAGRLLTPADEAAPGANPYVVLDHRFWLRHFHGQPDTLGRTVRLNSAICTVVGIARPSFRGTQVGNTPDFYVPLTMWPALVPMMRQNWARPTRQWLVITARLEAGVTLPQAEAVVASLLGERGQRRSGSSMGPGDGADQSWQPVLLPGAGGFSPLRARYRKSLLVLLAAVGLVLLLACANVAGLFMVRAESRRREIAVRLALGASRGRVIRQLLTESLLLAVLGGMAGTLFGSGCAEALVGLLMPETTNVVLDVSPNVYVLGFGLVVSVLAGIVFGLTPSLGASRPALTPALKGAGRRLAGSLGRHLDARRLLIVFQVALSLVLLVGVGLLSRSFAHLLTVDTGFARDHVLLVSVEPTQHGYDAAQAHAFYENLRNDVAALPGVRGTSLSAFTPLDGGNSGGTVSAPGRPGDGVVETNHVTAGYLATLGVPLLAGRDLSERDATAGANRVGLITKSLAQRMFPGASPLGRRFSLEEQYDASQSYEIVGVVGDSRYFGLRNKPVPMAYVPVESNERRLVLSVRTVGPPESLIPLIRRKAAALDPTVPIQGAKTMKDRVDLQVSQERLLAALVSAFGLIALVLVATGLHGVLAQAVASRTREIGIRVALGGGRSDTVGIVLKDAARLVGSGAVLGIVASVAALRSVTSLLYGVEPLDTPSLVMALGVVAIVSLVASSVPAWRAARVEPAAALRNE